MSFKSTPRAYYYSIRCSVFMVMLGLPMSILFFVGLCVYIEKQYWMFASMCLLMTLLGVWCVIAPLFSKLFIFHQNELQVPGFIRTKIVHRNDIVGFRIISLMGYKVLRIETKGVAQESKNVEIPMLFKADDFFKTWFEGVQNLGELELPISIKSGYFESDCSSERRGHVDYTSVTFCVIYLVILIFVGWLIIFPCPSVIPFLLVAALPWFAIFISWKSKGKFSIYVAENTIDRSNISMILIFPSVILGMQALEEIKLVDAMGLVIPAIIGLIVMLICIVLAVPLFRKNPRELLVVGVILSVYNLGTIAFANTLFDRLPSKAYLVDVLQKRRTEGKVVYYYLEIISWGPFSKITDVQVPRELYDQTKTGQKVCFFLHQGAVGIPWYSVGPRSICQPNYPSSK